MGSGNGSGVGQRRAAEAAKAVGGTVVIPPVLGDWNDMHRSAGAETVKRSVLAALEESKPKIDLPDVFDEQNRELHKRGLPTGDKPGWRSLDKLYTVLPGMMTVVTGWPGAGKSEFLDAMLVNLAENDGWQFVVHSPENQPIELHIAKLIEKIARKPFGEGPSERVTELERSRIVAEMSKSRRFAFMHSAAGSISVADIIEAAAPFLDKCGPRRGLVIDPWNELEHWRPQGMNETEYVSMTLSTVRNWARATKTHVWIVAHPQKLRRSDEGKLPVPKPDMISGSVHWWNKADACISVHREIDPSAGNSEEVFIHVTKMRFKHLGQVGIAQLLYDRVTGRYHDGGSSVADF